LVFIDASAHNHATQTVRKPVELPLVPAPLKATEAEISSALQDLIAATTSFDMQLALPLRDVA
jgi:hypothetical protein